MGHHPPIPLLLSIKCSLGLSHNSYFLCRDCPHFHKFLVPLPSLLQNDFFTCYFAEKKNGFCPFLYLLAISFSFCFYQFSLHLHYHWCFFPLRSLPNIWKNFFLSTHTPSLSVFSAISHHLPLVKFLKSWILTNSWNITIFLHNTHPILMIFMYNEMEMLSFKTFNSFLFFLIPSILDSPIYSFNSF